MYVVYKADAYVYYGIGLYTIHYRTTPGYKLFLLDFWRSL